MDNVIVFVFSSFFSTSGSPLQANLVSFYTLPVVGFWFAATGPCTCENNPVPRRPHIVTIHRSRGHIESAADCITRKLWF